MSSDGKLSVGSKSTLSKSRTVLRYSTRLSRRMVTRPGSGLALRSEKSQTAFTFSVNVSTAATVGRDFFFGGISPMASIRNTFSKVLRPFTTDAESLYSSSDNSAFGLSPLWHSRQCFFKKGNPFCEKSGATAKVKFSRTTMAKIVVSSARCILCPQAINGIMVQ